MDPSPSWADVLRQHLPKPPDHELSPAAKEFVPLPLTPRIHSARVCLYAAPASSSPLVSYLTVAPVTLSDFSLIQRLTPGRYVGYMGLASRQNLSTEVKRFTRQELLRLRCGPAPLLDDGFARILLSIRSDVNGAHHARLRFWHYPLPSWTPPIQQQFILSFCALPSHDKLERELVFGFKSLSGAAGAASLSASSVRWRNARIRAFFRHTGLRARVLTHLTGLPSDIFYAPAVPPVPSEWVSAVIPHTREQVISLMTQRIRCALSCITRTE